MGYLFIDSASSWETFSSLIGWFYWLLSTLFLWVLIPLVIITLIGYIQKVNSDSQKNDNVFTRSRAMHARDRSASGASFPYDEDDHADDDAGTHGSKDGEKSPRYSNMEVIIPNKQQSESKVKTPLLTPSDPHMSEEHLSRKTPRGHSNGAIPKMRVNIMNAVKSIRTQRSNAPISTTSTSNVPSDVFFNSNDGMNVSSSSSTRSPITIATPTAYMPPSITLPSPMTSRENSGVPDSARGATPTVTGDSTRGGLITGNMDVVVEDDDEHAAPLIPYEELVRVITDANGQHRQVYEDWIIIEYQNGKIEPHQVQILRALLDLQETQQDDDDVTTTTTTTTDELTTGRVTTSLEAKTAHGPGEAKSVVSLRDMWLDYKQKKSKNMIDEAASSNTLTPVVMERKVLVASEVVPEASTQHQKELSRSFFNGGGIADQSGDSFIGNILSPLKKEQVTTVQFNETEFTAEYAAKRSQRLNDLIAQVMATRHNEDELSSMTVAIGKRLRASVERVSRRCLHGNVTVDDIKVPTTDAFLVDTNLEGKLPGGKAGEDSFTAVFAGNNSSIVDHSLHMSMNATQDLTNTPGKVHEHMTPQFHFRDTKTDEDTPVAEDDTILEDRHTPVVVSDAKSVYKEASDSPKIRSKEHDVSSSSDDEEDSLTPQPVSRNMYNTPHTLQESILQRDMAIIPEETEMGSSNSSSTGASPSPAAEPLSAETSDATTPLKDNDISTSSRTSTFKPFFMGYSGKKKSVSPATTKVRGFFSKPSANGESVAQSDDRNDTAKSEHYSNTIIESTSTNGLNDDTTKQYHDDISHVAKTKSQSFVPVNNSSLDDSLIDDLTPLESKTSVSEQHADDSTAANTPREEKITKKFGGAFFMGYSGSAKKKDPSPAKIRGLFSR